MLGDQGHLGEQKLWLRAKVVVLPLNDHNFYQVTTTFARPDNFCGSMEERGRGRRGGERGPRKKEGVSAEPR